MLFAGLESGDYSIVYPRTFGISVKSGRPSERGDRTQSVKAQRRSHYRWINALHLYVDRANFGEAGADSLRTFTI